MFSLLLAIIYLSFISLGLPDSLLGSAWPVMQVELGVPISYAGIITMIIAGSTIGSSLMADRMIRKMGAGLLTAVSVALTAAALMGFSVSSQFWMLCLWAIPYGVGAGAVDAGLNNYVALHYSSRQMSWLHAFWGVGVSISPAIMGACLSGGTGWTGGYRTVSLLQIVLTAILFFSLPLWKKSDAGEEGEEPPKVLSLREVFRLRGAVSVLIAFFAYCAVEQTTGLWASSYLVEFRHVNEIAAARFASLYYLGITAGRFLNGFVSDRFGDKTMVRVGILTVCAGIVMIALPLKGNTVALAGLLISGLGAAPIYPCIIHSTPENFGRENSQSLVGVQMAAAYVGMTFMPPIFGLIARYVNIGLYPAYLLIFAVLTLVMTERLNRQTSHK